MTRCKIRVGSRRGYAKLLDDCESSRFVHDDEPFAPDGDGVVSQPTMCGTFHGSSQVESAADNETTDEAEDEVTKVTKSENPNPKP